MEKNFFHKVLTENQKGFSLIEILIALTLLALAGTFVVGKFLDNMYEGQVNSTKIQMSNLEGRLKEFRRKCGFYPTTEQGLEALVSKPTGGRECKDYPQNGFIDGDQVPKDPWEHDFIYESDGKTYNIYSYGTDGEPGGEGNDVDIYLKAGAKGSTPTGGTAPAEGGGGDVNNEATPQ
ncbi:MAG: type II secretion system major pseudopilin GspG [Bacteriovorax sp.]